MVGLVLGAMWFGAAYAQAIPGPQSPRFQLYADGSLVFRLDAKGMTGVQVVDPSKADIMPLRTEPYMQLVGKSAGTTTLRVEFGEDTTPLVYTVEVLPSSKRAIPDSALKVSVGESVLVDQLRDAFVDARSSQPAIAELEPRKGDELWVTGVAPGVTDLVFQYRPPHAPTQLVVVVASP